MQIQSHSPDTAAAVAPVPAPQPESFSQNPAAESPAAQPVLQEFGGPAGPEPTRYGDWERKGRCIDF